ncbi:MAG: hypothetical protein DWH91_07235 [Planctomycetota bacterium]|nr:MAG: hypothetical protein DWH91_07235 [Planctomycetota bacterium]
MSAKIVFQCIVVCVCSSAGILRSWTITSPEVSSVYTTSATISSSGTGAENATGQVQLVHTTNDWQDIIMDSKSFTWEEETMWTEDFEASANGWIPSDLAAVRLYDTSSGSLVMKTANVITIGDPE